MWLIVMHPLLKSTHCHRKPCRFAPSQTICCRQHESRLCRGRAGFLQEPTQLLQIERPADVPFPFGQDHIAGQVVLQQPLDHRVLHTLVDNCVEFEDRRRRIALLVLGIYEGLEVAYCHVAEGKTPGIKEGLDVPPEHIAVAVHGVVPYLRLHHAEPLPHERRDRHIDPGHSGFTGCRTLGRLAEVHIQAAVLLGVDWPGHRCYPSFPASK